jgi:hypothetical protein
VIIYSNSLIIGNSNPSNADYDDGGNLYTWFHAENSSNMLEIRIPWGMIGFYDPSSRRVIDYFSAKGKLVSTLANINATFFHSENGINLIYNSKFH